MSSRRDRVEELSLQRKSCFLSLPPSPLLLPSASVSVARMGCKALSRTRRDSGAGAEAAGAKKERERERAQQEEKKTSSSSKKKKGAANEKSRIKKAENAPSPSRLCPFWTVSRAGQGFRGSFLCARAAEEEERVERERGSAVVFCQVKQPLLLLLRSRLFVRVFFLSLFLCSRRARTARAREREKEKTPTAAPLHLFTSFHSSAKHKRRALFFHPFLVRRCLPLDSVSRNTRVEESCPSANVQKTPDRFSFTRERERGESRRHWPFSSSSIRVELWNEF